MEPLQQYRSNWQDEQNSAMLYRIMAEAEKDERIKEVYQRMAVVELKHAETWAEKIKTGGGSVPSFHPSWRANVLVWLARRLGPSLILPSIQAMEQNGSASYRQQAENTGMVADEKSHAKLINQIVRSMGGGVEGGLLAQFEGRHRAFGGNALRAAVLGANDGLVSNLSLVMGVAGASLQSRTILITGIAGLLAGSCSMALGEWLSVQSSRELYTRQIKIEADEIENSPAEEAEELALIYQARGLSLEQSRILADQILSNKTSALDTLAREELGMDPKELGGSAWEAAITSFFLFTLGAIIPVFPYFYLSGTNAVIVSIICSIIGLFFLGAAITLFTGKSVLYSGIRMVVFSLLAAAITFTIGRLIGVSLGG